VPVRSNVLLLRFVTKLKRNLVCRFSRASLHFFPESENRAFWEQLRASLRR